MSRQQGGFLGSIERVEAQAILDSRVFLPHHVHPLEPAESVATRPRSRFSAGSNKMYLSTDLMRREQARHEYEFPEGHKHVLKSSLS